MIDLAIWNLSVPSGSAARTIATPRLVGGYTDGYFRAGDTLFFWAPVTGSKSENAIYPRTELRETYANGAPHNWTYTQAENILRATLMVNQVPSSGKIVIGQIHCYASTQPLLKLEYQFQPATQTGNLVLKFRLTPTSEPEAIQLASGVKLNERFNYAIHLSPSGNLMVNGYDRQWSRQLDLTWKGKPLYFKAGVYVQDNSGATTEGGAATFYKLQVNHDKPA